MRIDASRAIGAYAAVMTLAALWLGLSAIAPPPAKFTTIDVQRINVREPDGTLRLTISNHALIPGIIVGKKEYAHLNRPEAGMIFFNDEGIENGGLVFDGGLKEGRPTNGGSFTFDRYMQDQTLQLISTEDARTVVSASSSTTGPISRSTSRRVSAFATCPRGRRATPRSSRPAPAARNALGWGGARTARSRWCSAIRRAARG